MMKIQATLKRILNKGQTEVWSAEDLQENVT